MRNFSSLLHLSGEAELDGKTAPRFLADLRQLYKVAVLMPSWLANLATVRL
nr:hypothetical protein [Terasakiispira papahanaumokuakeensis]